MLSARGDEADIVAGLELGAEDYVTKPFSPRVLSARIKTVIKRSSTPPPDAQAVLSIEGLTIDPGRRQVHADGALLDLTFTEFSVLHFLARQPGWVFSRHQIVDGVRGGDYPVTDRSVDVQIVGLRKKLGSYGNFIETVRGVGYRFRGEE
jgi:two-component system phosphate regulon response regulator PhoB